MTRNHNKISDTILDKMAVKMAAVSGVRPRTCWVANATACGDYTARMIVASMEPFTVAEAVSCIQETLDNKVTPFAPSFTQLISEAHPNLMFASVHGYKQPQKIRPVDEATMARCQSITAATYLDVDLGNVWERTEIGGKQYLIRANDDDLDEVMSIAMTASVAKEVQIKADGFIVTPKAGEFITFFAAEQAGTEIRPFIDVAQVTEVTSSSIGICIEENGHSASAFIPTASVVNVLATDGVAALDGKLTRTDIINYLKEAYGPEYASALDRIK